LRLLFIAEAPPVFKVSRLFYFLNLTDGDILFLEMMKVLYPEQVGFAKDAFCDGHSAKDIRKNKKTLLTRFQSDGYYLIDASECPMPDGATSSEKAVLIKRSLTSLMQRTEELIPDKKIPIILIGAVTYRVCSGPLQLGGWDIVNKATIKHPARGGQVFYRSQLRVALNAIRWR
jgi:hypothetical protein